MKVDFDDNYQERNKPEDTNEYNIYCALYFTVSFSGGNNSEYKVNFPSFFFYLTTTECYYLFYS